MFPEKRNTQYSRQRKYLNPQKSYNNPFFESRPRKTANVKKRSSFRFAERKLLIILVVICIILIVGFWFSFYSSYFMIKHIEARGEGRLDTFAIEQLAWDQIHDSDFILWQQKNIFIFDEEELIETLKLKYAFNEIIVEKKLADKIIIKYNEKEHSMIWFEKGIYYYADPLGYIIERIGDQNENKDYPIVENVSEFVVNNSKVTIDQELIKNVFVLNDKFKKIDDMTISRFLIESNSTTLKIVLENGPNLFFNIVGDLDKQINKIETLKNDILKEDFFKKEYIDVRIGDRVYHR